MSYPQILLILTKCLASVQLLVLSSLGGGDPTLINLVVVHAGLGSQGPRLTGKLCGPLAVCTFQAFQTSVPTPVQWGLCCLLDRLNAWTVAGISSNRRHCVVNQPPAWWLSLAILCFYKAHDSHPLGVTDAETYQWYM